jgi:mRNA interferase RelE/StbE
VNAGRYRLEMRRRAERQLTQLPLGVASAALEFVLGPLLDNPRRVGKPLRGRYKGQHSARCGADHRIRYEIDDAAKTVFVIDISRRADTYGRD